MKIINDMKNTIERQKQSWEGMFYSIQRIDLLIISISGAGIYVCLETLKFLTETENDVNLIIKISAVFFLFAIIVNFLSQIFGYKSNEKDYLMCQTEIESDFKPNEFQQTQIDNYDKISECYSKLTNWFNYSSMLLMFIGLITLMIYFVFIF
ncbi:MAG: hypothetical protein KGZ87_05075 [Bacteroidetes bacterium]|nr:hypothetical protein [Bacteroidota bacterium]